MLALLVKHPRWGVIALPLLSRLYVRKKDLPTIDPKHRPEFRTELLMAVEMLRWAKLWLGLMKRPIWLVADGVYAKTNVLKGAKDMGVTVVSRLRKDAALRTLPGPKPADRFSLEIAFREVKEVVDAGKQQVRFIHASVGAFHVCLWIYTMTEAWAWNRSASELVDRSESPWDSPTRRPSHADKRRAWRREVLLGEILALLRSGPTDAEIQAAADRPLRLAAR